MLAMDAASKSGQWAHGAVVSHPLRMRKALGSNPSVSTLFAGCRKFLRDKTGETQCQSSSVQQQALLLAVRSAMPMGSACVGPIPASPSLAQFSGWGWVRAVQTTACNADGICPRGFDSRFPGPARLPLSSCLAQFSGWGGGRAVRTAARGAEGVYPRGFDSCFRLRVLPNSQGGKFFSGRHAASEDRTHDLRILRPTRYQLRYRRS